MKKIKAAVIGMGLAGQIHVEALQSTGLVEVQAVASSNLESAERISNLYTIPQAYGDYRKLLVDPDIEAIHVCTPNDTHHVIAKDVMLAGKSVICEKPFTLSIDEARELAEIAGRIGVINAVNFNMRYFPMVFQARDMIQSGELGEVYSVQGSYMQDSMLLDSDYNWRIEPERSGPTRVIGDIGSHWCDCVEFMIGSSIEQLCSDIAIFRRTRKKPTRVIDENQGNEGQIMENECERTGVRTEDYASILFRMDNGAHGSVALSQCMAGRKNRMLIEIAGSKKSIAFDTDRANELWIGSRETPNSILLNDRALMSVGARDISNAGFGSYTDTFKQLFRRIYLRIEDKKHPYERMSSDKADYPTFEDGLRALSISNAVLRSQKQMSWVNL